MFQIFWEITEKSKAKKEIEQKLRALVKNFFSSPKFFAFGGQKVRLIFTDSKRIKELNKIYRKKNDSTDVLSFRELDSNPDFPLLQEKNSLGEIYINYQWIKEDNREVAKWKKDQASDNLPSILLLHGLLHLLGFDHEKDDGKMEKLEKKLRKELT